eukprot:TRINITY_DN1798_c0_g2_i1.p1 TRINITY_DN1798_c0_g2~~TRINITY_DN1798_c0_g2_i1.p1  ORF type:complete len:213 (-),score=87.25 TRINITY_DN1798_c0_g2_i1:166-804(-)
MYGVVDLDGTAGGSDSAIGLVMELAPSCPLRPLSDRQVLQIGRQLANGLSDMHRFRLVHRDLKPANVLCSPDYGSVKICDLGLAEMEKECDKYGGSAEFVAPEVGKTLLFPNDGHRYDTKADIYSLAITLWCFKHGVNKPYPDWHAALDEPGGVELLLDSVLHDGTRPEMTASMRASALGAILEQCWQANPGERPTAAELVALFADAAAAAV